jgi:hypothetical protein
MISLARFRRRATTATIAMAVPTASITIKPMIGKISLETGFVA